MLIDELVVGLLVRMSIVLGIGWLLLVGLRKRDPRWSVLITRSMIASCLCLPLMTRYLPDTPLPVLPNVDVAEGHEARNEKSTKTAPNESSNGSVRFQKSATPNRVKNESVAQPKVHAESIAQTKPVLPPGEFAKYVAREQEDSSRSLASGIVHVDASASESSGPSLGVILWLWGCVTCLLILRTLIQLAASWRVVSRSTEWNEPHNESERLLTGAHSRVHISDEIDSPCTSGLIRPVILLPQGWLQKRSGIQLRAILAHEQSHVDGLDLHWDLLCRIASSVWWFHPMVWFLRRRHRLACELTSDSRAAGALNDFATYRRWLAEWTLSGQHFGKHRRGAAGTFAMAERSLMMHRLSWLKNGHASGEISKSQQMGTQILAAVLLIAAATIQLTHAVAQDPAEAAPPDNVQALDPQKAEKAEDPSGITVRVIDEKGKPISTAIPVLAQSRRWPREFTPVPNTRGTFRLDGIDKNRRSLLVADQVAPGNGKATYQFSDFIDVSNPPRVNSEGTMVVTLRPGVRFRGRLDDSVPRPIRFGFVELCVTETLDVQDLVKLSRWRDVADIQPDGSFEFPSIPRGSHAQILALTDGYISEAQSDEETREILLGAGVPDDSVDQQLWLVADAWQPRLYSIDSMETVDVEIPCRPTAAVDVKVINPLGEPIQGAKVTFNGINGRFHGAGGVATFYPGLDGMVDTNRFGIAPNQLDDSNPFGRRHQWARDTYLETTTDESGIARLRCLPLAKNTAYRVETLDYVMPLHPIVIKDAIDPSVFARGSSSRFATVDLVSGKTQRRTVTMERFVEKTIRELVITSDRGEPVSGVELTAVELSTQGSPDDWVSWSIPRFGTPAKATTDQDGMVRMTIPTKAGNEPIAKIRVVLTAPAGNSVYVNRQYCAVPVVDDGGVIRLTLPKSKLLHGTYQTATADYVNPKEVFEKSRRELFNQFLDAPSVVLLRQLLSAAEFDSVEPLTLEGEWNLLGKPHATSHIAVARVPTRWGERVVAIAGVRPKGATWVTKPSLSRPPQAAFVFDADSGELIKMIGGWVSARGSMSDVMLTNLGGTEDFFIQTDAFEDHDPFEMRTHWFHLGREQEPALTMYNFANATEWDGRSATTKPPAVFGYMMYEFNGREIDNWLAGQTDEGFSVPRKIYWDAAAKMFVGAVKQSFQGKAIYRVVEDQSKWFEPIEPVAGQAIVIGGRTGRGTRTQWDVIVPEGSTGSLLVTERELTDPNGAPKVLRSVTLQEGMHLVGMRTENDEPSPAHSQLKIIVGDSSDARNQIAIHTPGISSKPKLDPASPKRVVRQSENSIELLRLESQDAEHEWVIQVTLR